MAIEDEDTGWRDYRRFVVEELRRINITISAITEKIERFRQDDIAQLKTDIALLKFQAGMFGALGGTIFGALATAIVSLIFRTMR
jgi:hypothetical protein